MSEKIIITLQPKKTITVVPKSTTQINSGNVALSVEINNNNRLDRLNDVVEGIDPSNGDTLVYDDTTDTYVVKKLSINDIDGGIDGGNF